MFIVPRNKLKVWKASEDFELGKNLQRKEINKEFIYKVYISSHMNDFIQFYLFFSIFNLNLLFSVIMSGNCFTTIFNMLIYHKRWQLKWSHKEVEKKKDFRIEEKTDTLSLMYKILSQITTSMNLMYQFYLIEKR